LNGRGFGFIVSVVNADGTGFEDAPALQAPVGKRVGRRKPTASCLNAAADSKENARRWRKAFPTPFIPRGVWRFRTHEEADEWMWKAIARRKG
jgi:hypothetical protein